MAHLGHMYANGRGVAQSNATAMSWFLKAKDANNHPSALYGLGYMHLSGYGVPMDHRKAFKFFSAAAEQVGRFQGFWGVQGLRCRGIERFGRRRVLGGCSGGAPGVEQNLLGTHLPLGFSSSHMRVPAFCCAFPFPAPLVAVHASPWGVWLLGMARLGAWGDACGAPGVSRATPRHGSTWA
jgi:Sel1 repeat